MDTDMNYITRSVAVLLCSLLLATSAGAVDWNPDKNIEIVIGTGPGGGNDRVGRTIHKLLTDLKLVTVNSSVMNKAGGSGFIAWSYLNLQSGNGNYLATSTPSLLTSHIVGSASFTYSGVTPIAQLYAETNAFIVKPDSKIQSAKDLINRIKSSPDSFTTTIGTSSGNNNHIALGMLARAVGGDSRKLKVVVFKSSSEATTAVLGGHVDLAIVAASSRRKDVEAGTLKALAVASSQRLSGPYANVPTWRELGVNVISAYWIGIIGPRGLSREKIDFWDQVFAKMTRSDDWKSYLERFSLEDTYLDSKGSAAFLEKQYMEYKETLIDLGLAKTDAGK